MCVCVCVREREREIYSEREREREQAKRKEKHGQIGRQILRTKKVRKFEEREKHYIFVRACFRLKDKTKLALTFTNELKTLYLIAIVCGTVFHIMFSPTLQKHARKEKFVFIF